MFELLYNLFYNKYNFLFTTIDAVKYLMIGIMIKNCFIIKKIILFTRNIALRWIYVFLAIQNQNDNNRCNICNFKSKNHC